MRPASGTGRFGAEPVCPRCGYDLSGVVATWEASCPLEGVCSECGAGVVWSEVVSGRELGPRWSIEHGRRGLARRWWGTLRRSVRPRVMWRELDPDEPVRAGRAVAYAVGTVGVLHVLLMAGVAADLYRLYGWRPWSWYGGAQWGMVWPYRHLVEFPFGGGGSIAGPAIGVYVSLAVLPAALMPPVVLALGVVARPWRVRAGHALRGACYSAPLAMVAGIVIAAAFNAVFYAETRGATAGFPDRTPLGAALTLAALVAYPFWLGFWWRSLLRDQARVRRAGWAASVATVLSLGGAILLMVLWETCIGPY